MAEGEKRFSHITLEKAADEEVVRISAAGVEQLDTAQGGSEPLSGSDTSAAGSSAAAEPAATARKSAPKTSEKASTVDEAVDNAPLEEPRREPVPMAGMQKVIVIVLVLALIAFFAYFFLRG